MTKQDLPRLVAVMLKLQSVFPKEINEHTYGAYFETLKSRRIEDIERAGGYFMGNSRFFPLPSDFLEQIPYREPPAPTMEQLENTQSFKDWRDKYAKNCNRCGKELKSLIDCRFIGNKWVCSDCLKKLLDKDKIY